jgi:hypothetical protein
LFCRLWLAAVALTHAPAIRWSRAARVRCCWAVSTVWRRSRLAPRRLKTACLSKCRSPSASSWPLAEHDGSGLARLRHSAHGSYRALLLHPDGGHVYLAP